MKPRDVLIGTAVGGSIIGLVFMALGVVILGAAWNDSASISAHTWEVELVEGGIYFVVGAAFLLVSAILIPALRAIELEGSRRT